MNIEEILRKVFRIELKVNKLLCGNITHLNVNCIPVYANDAAAIAGNLKSGDLYRTTTGDSTFLKILP